MDITADHLDNPEFHKHLDDLIYIYAEDGCLSWDNLLYSDKQKIKSLISKALEQRVMKNVQEKKQIEDANARARELNSKRQTQILEDYRMGTNEQF